MDLESEGKVMVEISDSGGGIKVCMVRTEESKGW
jgi:hypothetical protein